MSLHAQRQCLEALEQQKGVERTDGGSCVAQYHARTLGNERILSGDIGKHSTVVARVGLRQLGNLPDAAQSNRPESTITPPSDVP